MDMPADESVEKFKPRRQVGGNTVCWDAVPCFQGCGLVCWRAATRAPAFPSSTRISDPQDPLAPRDRFEIILNEMAVTHRAKAHDYGDSLSACEQLGVSALLGILIRMSDKWSRIVTLYHQPAVVSETLTDTLLDLAAYAILAVVEMEEKA